MNNTNYEDMCEEKNSNDPAQEKDFSLLLCKECDIFCRSCIIIDE